MNDTGTDDAPLVELYIEGVILICIALCAIVGNSCMWIIICRSPSLRTVTNSFILGLTIADLLVSIVNMPVTVITLFQGGIWPFSESACVVFGFLNMLTLVTSVMSLCNISINRYIMVCKPIHFKKIYTKRNAALMLTACYLISFTISTPPLMGWAKYSFIEIQSFCFCDWTRAPSYAFFMIGACFGLPFAVMSVCNLYIFRTVRASKRKLEPQTRNSLSTDKSTRISTIGEEQPSNSNPSSTDSKHLTVPGRGNSKKKPNFLKRSLFGNKKLKDRGGSVYLSEESVSVVPVSSVGNTANPSTNTETGNTGMSAKRRRRGKARTEEIRLATALAVIVVVFVICWLPYCISMVLSLYGPEDVPRGFHMFTLLIGYLNSCCNPIIYGVMNKKFGDGFRKIFCFWRKEST